MRRTLAFLVCFFLLLSAVAADEQLVRVGWYPIEKLEELDASGNPSGFGKDCLTALARFTGFTYDYVPGSFEECITRLENGDIDLMLFMKYTPQRGELMDYSDSPLFKVSSLLTCLKGKAESYEDIVSINGKIVALEGEAIQTKELDSFIEGKGITYTPLFCADSSEVKKAVDERRADYAFLPSVVPLSPLQSVVESIDTRFSTITISKKRPDILTKVNRGMAALIDDDPSFFENRYKAYFGTSTTSTFYLTKEERDAIERLGTMKVYLNEEEGYLSRYENGKFTGIRTDLVKLIAERLNMDYEFVHLDDPNEILNWQQDDRIDFVSGIVFDYNLARERGYLVTSPYITYKYYNIKHKGYTGTLDQATVATLPPGNYFTDTYIIPAFRKEQLRTCKNREECLDMVNRGKADMTFMSSYIAEYYLQGYDYANVTTSLTEYATEVCFATKSDMDPFVIAAIDKAIGNISSTEMQTIILQNTIPNASNMTIKVLFNKSPVFFSILSCAIIVIIIVSILLVIFYRKLSAKNRQLEKASQAKSEFLSRMSHDMRTPLNAILGCTNLAMEEEDVPPMTRDYLEKIGISGTYLLSLINDVLDMSRIENGKFILHEKCVDSLAFLSNMNEVFKSEAKEKGIVLLANFTEAQTKWIIMDDVRTRQIYANLLSNAIKFSQSGTTITWTLRDTPLEHGMIRRTSTITDQGCGMSEEFMKRMYNPFEQEKAENASVGTGLGLAIVNHLVSMMGGTITVVSKIGVGTSFTVVMDRKVGTKPSEETDHKQTSVSLKGKRILLCEDNQVNTMVATRFLQKTECTTECALNGKEGVEKFSSSPVGYYALILMDIRMPEMDGLMATRIIRKMDRKDAKTIPIIAMSANAFEDDVKKSIEAGMNAHLSKPIEPEKFFAVLKKYVKDQEGERLSNQ